MKGPAIDWQQLSPLIALVGGAVVVLCTGLLSGRRVQRLLVPALTVAAFAAAIGLSVWNWQPGDREPIVAGALVFDTLTLAVTVICSLAGALTVLLSLRSEAVREAGAGEYFALLLGSVAGMVILAGAEDFVALFIGIELLSIPLYVLCGSLVRRGESLESGLKYLVIGSVGSATLLYGLALLYGATGTTALEGIRTAVEPPGGINLTDPLVLTGVALTATGLAFKASIAPFHQWTPDVYEGAPTPVTAFMAVATKAAAFGIALRFFSDALASLQLEWGPALAALALVTIVVGNVGAIPQRSMKRMLAWSGVAQAGYLLAGVVVGTALGMGATVFYLAVYLLMNVAAFAVVIARERRDEHGDDIAALEGLGVASPWLAVSMTLAMLALAGFPFTAGFWGKFGLIQAAVDGDYEWLGIAIVVGSVISLVYYLRVLAVMWMTPLRIELPGPPRREVRTVGGWSPEADARAQPEVAFVAILCGAAILAFGIYPEPLFDLAREVGSSLGRAL